MLRSLNSGVAGLRAFQTKLDVIGNNIANVNTTSFKKSRVVFDDIFSQTVKNGSAPIEDLNSGGINPSQVGLGVKVATIENMFTPGSPTTTSNPNDLYIDGDGFFRVEKGDDTFLTRAGNFTVDTEGYLVNSNGYYVLDDDNAQITMPTDSNYAIEADGQIVVIDEDGNRDLKQKIDVVTVANTRGLSKEGGSLYSATSNSGNPVSLTDDFAVVTGTLEMSNVDLSEEMTEMIIAQRAFQANAKIITTSDSILEELVNLKR